MGAARMRRCSRVVTLLSSTLLVSAAKKTAISLILLFCFGNSFALGSPGHWDEKSLTTLGTIITFVSPLYSTEWTSDFSSGLSADRDNKILVQARDDAAAFVASEGKHRGAFLEAAIGVLNIRGMEQSDMALATWILSTTAFVQ